MDVVRCVVFGSLVAVAGGCASLRPGSGPAAQEAMPAAVPCLEGAGATALATGETIRDIQARLILQGYSAGAVDGMLGDRTRDAIRAYQADHGLLTDGLATPELSQHLRTNSIPREEARTPLPSSAGPR